MSIRTSIAAAAFAAAATWNSAQAAWTETVLHNFSNSGPDLVGGYAPGEGLILRNGFLYGTTFFGGEGAGGVVFRVRNDGTGFSVLRHFSNSGPDLAKGSRPGGPIVMDANGVIYGTTLDGGTGAGGVVFRLTPSGGRWIYRVLHNFSNSGPALQDGYFPLDLVIRDNILYGTTRFNAPAPHEGGVVFRIATDGTGYRVLRRFFDTGAAINNGYGPTSLAVHKNMLYGLMSNGGRGAGGVVYRMALNGSAFELLHTFSNSGAAIAKGYQPNVRSIVFDRNDALYAATLRGGSGAGGVVFRLRPPAGAAEAWTYAVLHHFSNAGADLRKGYFPVGGLVIRGNVLYGSASFGGQGQGGVVYRLRTDGTAFAVLKGFANSGPALRNGYTPDTQMTADGAGALYGLTRSGGSGQGGVVYKLAP